MIYNSKENKEGRSSNGVKKLEWKDEYSVNVKAIDEQHKNVINFINDLSALISPRGIEGEYKPVLEKMIDYADYHFSFEEKYFEEFDYEHTEVHKKQHDKYSQKIDDFKKKSINNSEVDIVMVYDMLDFLGDWWVDHILEVDKKYTKTLNDNGVY